jgi:hypothetical protein
VQGQYGLHDRDVGAERRKIRVAGERDLLAVRRIPQQLVDRPSSSTAYAAASSTMAGQPRPVRLTNSRVFVSRG